MSILHRNSSKPEVPHTIHLVATMSEQSAGPSRWQQRKDAKASMYEMSGEKGQVVNRRKKKTSYQPGGSGAAFKGESWGLATAKVKSRVHHKQTAAFLETKQPERTCTVAKRDNGIYRQGISHIYFNFIQEYGAIYCIGSIIS